MATNLVIVESPTKVKSVKKFLGSNYTVAASMGHVRDLPKSQLGIDLEHDFEPKYITIRGKGDLLAKLRKQASKAKTIYLATDPDREGEAIAWHLSQTLKAPEEKMKRISFNEITKTAVRESLKEAREIDMDLVDAQQVRRIVDRMVGYEISPILWKKIKRGLSAGRVQSVALRIIADREAEINAFIPKEYWTLDADFVVDGEKVPLTAHFFGEEKKKIEITSGAEAKEIMAEARSAAFSVAEIKKGSRNKKAPLPFTTSTLQQEASNALNMSTYKTMQIAQQLYEGVDLPKEGTVGLITYLRTDSTRISEDADAAARSYIEETYGADFVATEETRENRNKNAQDAHEAIRPTDIRRTPAEIKEHLTRDQFRLYQLIWRRFAASRMSQAQYETSTVRIKGGKYYFNAAASKLIHKGFLTVYTDSAEEKEPDDHLGDIRKDSRIELSELREEQHFTQPPAHYTEASLVRTMEELGIGRPSTYAPTITTIISRRYVSREQKKLYITELGEVVNEMMKQAFPSIVDVNFTANMEQLLDGVEEGKVEWKTIIRNFWPDFAASVKAAEEELESVEIEDEVTDVVCDKCGRKMVIKYGPYGKFLACPGFPECRNTKPHFEHMGVPCPLCGGEVVQKKTKKGRRYFGCENNPDCEFMSWQKPSKKPCPVCGKYMLEKGRRLVCSDRECGYVEQNSEMEETD